MYKYYFSVIKRAVYDYTSKKLDTLTDNENDQHSHTRQMGSEDEEEDEDDEDTQVGWVLELISSVSLIYFISGH